MMAKNYEKYVCCSVYISERAIQVQKNVQFNVRMWICSYKYANVCVQWAWVDRKREMYMEFTLRKTRKKEKSYQEVNSRHLEPEYGEMRVFVQWFILCEG